MYNLNDVKENLIKRGFKCQIFATKENAQNYLNLCCKGKSVGMGGSRTLLEMNTYEQLTDGIATAVYCHAVVPGTDTMRNAHTADIYLCSVNAMSKDGIIINIDGNGNRVGTTLMGPKELIFVVGKNKITENLDSALKRIRTNAAPLNAKRFNCKTPCVIEGKCDILCCTSEITICGQTVILEKPSRMIESTSVFLLDEEVGF